MSGERDCSRAPVYAARDLTAAEVDAYARGRVDGYVDGYRDGATGAAVAAAAEAATFAALVHRTFAGGVPHAELQARRDGPDSTNARRARQVHDELQEAVAASIATEQAAAGPARHPHTTPDPRQALAATPIPTTTRSAA